MHTVKSCYVEPQGEQEKVRDNKEFEILRFFKFRKIYAFMKQYNIVCGVTLLRALSHILIVSCMFIDNGSLLSILSTR